ncbi:MAG: hypothetical protein J6X49_04300 [Victivallales bacterium]|nr:hypothetical protein [Victivallales bacterium]
MAVDLSKVNISLDQFQNIASGKYNAGEVSLTSETTLGKINHHVHKVRANTKSLTHEEVLAIKNALVKALSEHGVQQEEINRIRRELGLGADTGIDKTLHERSLKPLTRQQVRQILDRNAATINSFKGNNADRVYITTSSLLYGANGMDAEHAERRDEINAALAGSRKTEAHQGLAVAEAIIAGDVDFHSAEKNKEILAHVKNMHKRLLDETNGNPSAEREAVVHFRMKDSGQEMSISTGMSELAFIRKLEGIIIRLSEDKNADARSVDVRTAFSALSTPAARLDWLNSLAGTPDAGFKVRTAFIQMLTEAGIDDWETLSVINRVNDEDALAAARSLVALNGRLRGDALRQDHMLVALSHLAENAVDVPENSRALVPATSPYQWNKTIRDAFRSGAIEKLPNEFKVLLDTVPAHLREMFGTEIVGKNAKAIDFIVFSGTADALLPDLNAAPATAESLRASLMTAMERYTAQRCACNHLENKLMAAGVGEGFSTMLWTAWDTTRPQLKERLLASRSAAETAQILAEVRKDVEGDVKRLVTAERCSNKVTALYKETLARELGVPSSCFTGGKPDMTIISLKASNMVSAILKGEIAVSTEADIEAVFRNYALDTAKKRAEVIRTVDKMGLPEALSMDLKTKLFKMTRVDKLDVPKTLEAARNAFSAKIDALYAALKPNASKEAVYAAMHQITGPLGEVVQSLLPEGAEMGVEETDAQGDIMMSFIVYSKEGLREKLLSFFNRADVKADTYYDPQSPAYVSAPIIVKLNEQLTNEAIVSTLGKPQMPPFHAKALMQAFEDAGLGAKSLAEKMAILRPTHPAGMMLSSSIRAQSEGISPSKLREIAEPILMAFGNADAERSEEDTERMNALLAKYNGGLSEAERARLHEFAEELDFSEEAAPASEKVLAERLDEICGGGGFNNPASSVSRRALASGFKLADLPALARMEEILDFHENDPAEAILDPQSEFRRNWDACMLRYAGTRANLDRVPESVKIAITKALTACKHDAELLTLVTNGINRIVRNGANALRNEDDIKEAVERVRANLQELREATADNPALLAAGQEMLLGLEARRVPNGFIKHLIDTVKQIQLNAVLKLRARSSAKDIHAALMQIYENVSAILVSGNSEGLFEGDDEVAPCRNFLVKAMVSRLDQRTRGRIRDALASENSSKLMAFYYMIENGKLELETLPEGVKGNLEGLSAKLSTYADHLNEAVHQALGEENAIIPKFNGVFDLNIYNEIKGPDILGEIKTTARTECDKACDNFLKKNFPGNSPVATALRNLYSAKLTITKPFAPDVQLSQDYSFATKHFLNLNIVRSMKWLETTGLEQSQFAKDRDRGFDVFLPNGQLLSQDPATAADELSRFVTGREDATYAALGKAEKTKVHFVMSILTQEANTATITGAGFALDPQGKNQMFEYGGNGQGVSRSFHLSKLSGQGDIAIDFETTLRPNILIVNGDLIPFQGNEIKGDFNLILSPEFLDDISNLDFAQCDNTASNEIYNRQQPVENKLKSSVGALPLPFQLNIRPQTSFAFNLNQ